MASILAATRVATFGLGVAALAVAVGCASSEPPRAPMPTDASPAAPTDASSADASTADASRASCVGCRFENVSVGAGLADDLPMFGRGAAWIDFDGDGWEDLWLSDGMSDFPGFARSSRLYRNAGGTLERHPFDLATSEEHANWVGAWGDIDNDGDPDLFLGNGGVQDRSHCTLLRNDVPSGGGFVNVTSAAGILPDERNWWGASFADYDGDGWLDLVVTTVSYAPGETRWSSVTAPVLLYHNEGGGTFTERATTFGLSSVVGNVKNPVWLDYDDDGDPDLLISGMHQLMLYRNDDGARFTDVTSAAFPASIIDAPNTWAAAAADFDQDGRQDLYLGRWDGQDYVLRNRGDGTFEPLGREIGLDMRLFPATRENTMGLGVGDLDDDGYPDLLLGPGRPDEAAPAIVYCNDGAGPLHFRRCSDDFARGHGPARHHGIALADFDHDGDTDVVFNLGGMPMPDPTTGELTNTDSAQQPALYAQNRASPPASAVIHLVGTVSNRSAIGARITVTSPSERHHYTVFGTQGFQSQNSDWIPVRLGAAAARVDVVWPSGRTSATELAVGTRVTLTEP